MQNQTKDSPLLVDPRKASQMLAVSPRKLWTMTFVDRPGLPYVRFGRLVRYPVADLERWIEAKLKGGQD